MVEDGSGKAFRVMPATVLLDTSTRLKTAVTRPRPVGCDDDPSTAVIGNQGVRHGKSARRIRKKLDAAICQVADDAVLDGQGRTRIEHNSIGADAGTFDDQAAQVDLVVRTGIDRDGGIAAGNRYPGKPWPWMLIAFVIVSAP